MTKIKTTIPKDKSNYICFDGREVKCSKKMVLFIKIDENNSYWVPGVYIHCRKRWYKEEGYYINNDLIIGWIDPDEFYREGGNYESN